MPDFEGMPTPARTWSVLAIWLALAMSVIDGAIANVALPTIARELSADPAYAIWVVNGYQLAVVVALLPLAALGEEFGYRRIFLGGILVFTIASAACALSHSLPMLIVTRVIQGLGGAGIMSVNGALVRFTYPPDRLGRGVGLNALVVSAAAAFGPTLASGVLALGPWEWLFAINAPIGLVTFLIGRRALPANPKALPTNPSEGKFDLISAGLNVLTFGFGFTGIDALIRGGDTWRGFAELALATTAGVGLIWRSNGQKRPLAPIDLLKNTVFAMAIMTSVASFSAQMLAFVSLPFYFQGVLHRSQVDTGLLMTPWPLAAGVAAVIAGRLADRFSAATLSAAGLAVLALGLVLLGLLPTETTALEISALMAVCGLGFGFFQAPNNRTMLSAAPLARSGAAGGMLATARLTGQTIGATIAAITFHFAAHAEEIALVVAALFAFAGALACLTRRRYETPVAGRQPIPVAP